MTEKKTKKNKNNLRNSKKYPALDKSVNLKRRQELIDYDYLHKLSPEELEFLNKFTEETVSGSFKKKNGKYSGNLHKKKSEKLEIWQENNARNRCQYTRAKAMNVLADNEEGNNHLENQSGTATNNVEDTVIDLITTEVSPTINFEKQGFEQVITKGGIRWIKKK